MDKGNKKKNIILLTLIYVAAAVLVTTIFVVTFYLNIQLKSIERDSFHILNKFEATYKFMMSKVDETSSEVENDLCVPARLTASALRHSGFEKTTGSYGGGWIIHKNGDKIEYPEGYDPGFMIKATELPEEYAVISTEAGPVSCAGIGEGYYYVEIQETSEEDDTIRDGVNYQEALDDYADAMGYDFISLNKNDKGKYIITAGTKKYSRFRDADELGVSELIDSTDRLSSKIMRINGKYNVVTCSRKFDTVYENDDAALMLIPLRNALLRTATLTFSLVFFVLMVCAAIAVWLISIYRRTLNGLFSEDQSDDYTYDKLKMKLIFTVIAITIFAYLFANFELDLDDLFIQTSRGTSTIDAYINRLEGDRLRSRTQWNSSQERYTENARRLAALLDADKSLRNNRKWLGEAANIIDADYIMLFDENGNELISDSDYKGITLNGRSNPEMEDFSRLFNGVESISHAGVKDEVTGQTRDYHGICLRGMSDKDSYGALLIAVDPNEHSWVNFRDHNQIADSMEAPSGFVIEVDPETGVIKYSSKKYLLGHKIKAEDLKGSFMGFMTLRHRDYFALSKMHKSKLFYYGVGKTRMFMYNQSFAMCYTLLFLLIIGVLSYALLSIYPGSRKQEKRKEEYDLPDDKLDFLSSLVLNAAESNESLVSLAEEEKALLRKRPLTEIYRSITPEREALSIFELLLSLFTLIVGLVMITHNDEGTVIAYISEGGWSRGLNLFAVAAVFFLFCALVVFLAFLKLLSAVVYPLLNMRSLTIFALAINILWYVSVVAFVILSLSYLGVDTRALIASAGFIGLAISMGSRDIISDIFAGIAIIASRQFEVGEEVEISDFGRGRVRMIGLCRTVLESEDGSTSSIHNSSISRVVNLSREGKKES